MLKWAQILRGIISPPSWQLMMSNTSRMVKHPLHWKVQMVLTVVPMWHLLSTHVHIKFQGGVFLVKDNDADLTYRLKMWFVSCDQAGIWSSELIPAIQWPGISTSVREICVLLSHLCSVLSLSQLFIFSFNNLYTSGRLQKPLKILVHLCKPHTHTSTHIQCLLQCLAQNKYLTKLNEFNR